MGRSFSKKRGLHLRKGFTLVELVVSFAIVSFITVALLSSLAVTKKLYEVTERESFRDVQREFLFTSLEQAEPQLRSVEVVDDRVVLTFRNGCQSVLRKSEEGLLVYDDPCLLKQIRRLKVEEFLAKDLNGRGVEISVDGEKFIVKPI